MLLFISGTTRYFNTLKKITKYNREKLPILLILMLLLAACGSDSNHNYDEFDDTHIHADGLNVDLFFEGALAEEPTIVDCTLSDGTETQCYEITIAGNPANHDVGPFCPETTDTVAEDAGIWFDGNGLYDMDGEFILGRIQGPTFLLEYDNSRNSGTHIHSVWRDFGRDFGLHLVG